MPSITTDMSDVNLDILRDALHLRHVEAYAAQKVAVEKAYKTVEKTYELGNEICHSTYR